MTRSIDFQSGKFARQVPAPDRGHGRKWVNISLRREAIVLVIILGAIASVLMVTATWRPLWYDELFSYYVATLDGLRPVTSALLAGADNGPPVDYWLRHLSMRVFGETAFGFRLPSIVAFLVTVLCLWAFLRKSISPVPAAAAILFFCTTRSVGYATEGRSYAMLLAFGALSLLAWQRAVEKPSRARLTILGTVLALGYLSHLYGFLLAMPIVAAELTRWWRRPKDARPILKCALISLLALILLIPFARHALEMRSHFWAGRFGLSAPVTAYREMLGGMLIPAFGLCLTTLVLVGLRVRRAPHDDISRAEVVAATASALTPFAVFALAQLYTNAMSSRYAIESTIGIAILIGFSAHLISRRYRVVPAVLALIFAVAAVGTLEQTFEKTRVAAHSPELNAFVEKSQGSIFVKSPRVFLECYHFLPAEQKEKLVFLVDRETARQYMGYDNDDIAIPKLASIVPLRTDSLNDFLAREADFLVLSGTSRWFVNALKTKGLHLTLVEHFGSHSIHRARYEPGLEPIP